MERAIGPQPSLIRRRRCIQAGGQGKVRKRVSERDRDGVDGTG